MLDAHTNIVSQSSVPEDYKGFLVVVGSPDEFPLTLAKSLHIRPGHYNAVRLSAMSINSLPNIMDLKPEERKCYLHHEKELKINRNYTQENCFLECSLNYATNKTATGGGKELCIPWYFPVPSDGTKSLDSIDASFFN